MEYLNPSIKHHLFSGGLLSIWVFFFAFLIRPFEHGDMDLRIWFNVALSFSGAAFISYGILTFLQKAVYRRFSKWNYTMETSGLLIFYTSYLVLTFLLYRSPFINGYYDLSEFTYRIILNIILILTPVILLARKYVLKLIPSVGDFITILGDYKLDRFRVKKDNIVCISSAHNYVEIKYLNGDQLKSKMIRSSLKKVEKDFPFLLRIHRSHLINPYHFKFRRNHNTISLTHVDLPISKSYRDQFLNYNFHT